ncbi:class I SAM-dependent methyltransferase [Streptomyces purpurascens]
MRAIELGCGTAYVSAWLARAGAHPVGIDLSEKQLATARAMQTEFGIASPRPGQRREGALRGQHVRPGDQRVRRLAVVRPLPVDPGRQPGFSLPEADWCSRATHSCCSRCVYRPRDRHPPLCSAANSA